MANTDYTASGDVRGSEFTPLSELAEDIDYLDHNIALGRTNFPRIDILKVGMAALCEDEFMAISSITSSGVVLKRGVADTVPAQHPKGSLIWFFDNSLVGTDGREYSAGQTTSVKYSPYTIGAGGMPVSNSEIDVVTYNFRFYRPYPPGQMRVRNERWYIPQILSADMPALRLTWAHRSRILEHDQLVDHDANTIGPEKGTTYTARIYDQQGNLRRTVAGIPAGPRAWTYTWSQAMTDIGFTDPLAEGEIVDAYIIFCSTRDGFDSWQSYRIDFKLDTQGIFLKVAQLAETAAQPIGPDAGTPPLEAVYVGQVADVVAQTPGPETPDTDTVAADGMYVGQVAEPIGQVTNFYTAMNRNLFEAPYAYLLARGEDPEAHKLVTVVARPSDRLTDTHDIWARYDWPSGTGSMLSYVEVANPAFTPWATLKTKVEQLTDVFEFDKTSFLDGVSLADLRVGMVAQLDAEMIRIDEITATGVRVARGCYDTVPAKHTAGTRIWFYGVTAGNDPTAYPERLVGTTMGGAVQVKMRPNTYGPQLNLDDVPTDRLVTKSRTQRPYPPGQVLVNDAHWFSGGRVTEANPLNITWVDRNRTAQGTAIVDHLAPDQGREEEQLYHLKISVTVSPPGGTAYVVVIREVTQSEKSFVYTYAMAKQDGYRAGSLLGACGSVTVGLVLESIRYGLPSWQNYVIPLSLPSYKCPIGQPPGGGQLPGTPGNGNGDTGNDTPGGQTPGGDDEGDGTDPIDNGGTPGGGNGEGPPKPPELPDDWPDPVDPPEVDPNDPNPSLAGHWDINWDRHWDAYTKDNTGD